MTVTEALKFFANIPAIRDRLQTLYDVGLGYIRLGQSATTLSGGEAQRINSPRSYPRGRRGRPSISSMSRQRASTSQISISSSTSFST